MGTYLSDRQWVHVREDYSPEGNAWSYINHDLARSYTYRWGEEGIAGFMPTRSFALPLLSGTEKIPL